MITVSSTEVMAHDSQPPSTNHLHNQAYVSYVCGHKTATLKHKVLPCKIRLKRTCGVQDMWTNSKHKILQIWKYSKTMICKWFLSPKMTRNTPRNTLGKSIREGKVPTYFWEVINTWFKVVKGLIWDQIQIVRAAQWITCRFWARNWPETLLRSLSERGKCPHAFGRS